MKYDAIFFDWDGVITDSVSVKADAFSEMFKEYGPVIQARVRSHHLQNGGMSRFEKFRTYYRDFLGISIDESKVRELSAHFSKLVKDRVIQASFIPGAVETITLAHREGTKLFVVSGTPTEEMKEIIEAKGLRTKFSGVGGAPCKKTDWVKFFCEKHGLGKRRCLFIGDAMEDYEAAKDNQLQFLGIKIPSCKTEFPQGTLIKEEVKL